MHKHIAFLFLGFSLSMGAQNYQSIEEVDAACAQLGFMGDEDAEIAVDNILSQVGLFKNFTIQQCPDINNAVAKNIDVGNGRKERFILYDNAFFDRIDSKAGNDWAAISILAHEIGHHLNGHALNDDGSNHQWELEADEFSGFVLARMGAELQDAQAAIQTLKYEKATRTHPAKADRLKAIAKGWSRGSGKKIVIPEVKVEDEVVEVIEDVIEEDVDPNKLKAQKVLLKYIDKIGGEEQIKKIRTLSQNFKLVTRVNVNGTLNETETQATMTFLSPSRYIMKYDTKLTNFSILALDGKNYMKMNPNEKWKFSSYTNENMVPASYIYEYSYLINNLDVKYKGVEYVDGIACHAVEVPANIISVEEDTFSTNTTQQMTHYFDVESGMLSHINTKTRTKIDYYQNNEYLKDMDTESDTWSTIVEYTEVNGVLFPSKQNMKISTDTGTTTSSFEYTDISANIPVDKNLFDPNN